MARPLRIEYPGAIYHVMSRGNEQRHTFYDNDDCARFLKTLGDVTERYNWLVHAYCLMNNHYHLLIETPDANLSAGMRQLNGIYTQQFNARHRRVGHLFQGRFKGILVERESYLLELCRYIVLNPVRAKMVADVEQYQWSSYGATAGLIEPPACLTTNWILSQFAQHESLAVERYRHFVNQGIAAAAPWQNIKHQLFLGGDAFIDKLAPLLDSKNEIIEIPRRQRFATRKPLASLFHGIQIGNPAQRDHAVVCAHLEHGHKLVDIAYHLDLHYSTISKIVMRSRRKT